MVTFSEFKTWLIPKLIISYTFIVVGFIVNIFQFLAYIFVWPFNRILYKRINYYLSIVLASNMTSIANYWGDMEFVLYCKDEDFKAIGKENSFIVINHKYELDWLVCWVMCQRANLLGGAKVVMKESIKYIPVLGWHWWLAEYIFVKRVWDTDNKSLVRDLKAILEYPKDIFYAISIFCESTRFSKAKHDASLEVAREKGLPQFKYHLLPRPKGFNLVASQLEGHVDYLYDMNIAIKDLDGKQPTIVDVQNGKQVKCMILFRRIPMSNVPKNNEKQAAEFLNKLYQEKDEIHDSFIKNGDFSKLSEYKKQNTPKNGRDLIIGIISLIVVFLPSAYYFLKLFWSGSFFLQVSIVLTCFAVNYLTNWMMDQTNSKKQSKFGLRETNVTSSSDMNNNHLNEKKTKKAD